MEPERKPDQNQGEELICDFTDMFKKGGSKPMPKLGEKNQKASQPPNWLLQIPAKLEITKADLEERKVLDMKRWMSQVRAEDDSLKIISSVISAWNFIHSKNISFASVFQIFDAQIIEMVRASQQFERQSIISKLINILNSRGHEKAEVKIIAKLAPPNQLESPAQKMKETLLDGLKSNDKAYIYLAYEDVFNGVGYQITPLRPLDAYKKLEEINQQDRQLWIMMNGTGKYDHSFVIKRWSNMKTDLETCWPDYYDIKKIKEGVKRRPEATPENQNQARGTSNCILQIRKII